MPRTVVEDEHTYAVRIDDGSMLDSAEQIAHARAHLTADGQRQLLVFGGGVAESSPPTLSCTRSGRLSAGCWSATTAS